MSRSRSRTWLAVFILALFAVASSPGFAGEALLLDLDGAIGPASAAAVTSALATAQRQDAAVLVLRIDTPGGLDTSMRAIVKAITSSPVPVIGYVAPAGARAASAGTYILYACHLAAMAPGTNLGAATPVQFGGLSGGAAAPTLPGDDKTPTAGGDAMTHKLVNDATAYLRSLAELRGRNADWAERAVRDGASLSAEAAAKLKVIDLIAPDLGDLLTQANGRTVETAAGPRVLATAGLNVVELSPTWPDRLLAVVSDPNIAYMLLLLGFWGLVYELANPGTVLPGTVGALCLLLALYAFQLLPVNWTGLALIGLGLGLMIAEAFAPSFGALGLGGITAFVLGSVILIDGDAPGYAISLPLIIGFALASAVLLVVVAGLAIRSHRRPVVTGAEQLLGAHGTVVSGFPGEGAVHLRGEVWSARCPQSMPPGSGIRVLARDGMTLLVEPLSDA